MLCRKIWVKNNVLFFGGAVLRVIHKYELEPTGLLVTRPLSPLNGARDAVTGGKLIQADLKTVEKWETF